MSFLHTVLVTAPSFSKEIEIVGSGDVHDPYFRRIVLREAVGREKMKTDAFKDNQHKYVLKVVGARKINGF